MKSKALLNATLLACGIILVGAWKFPSPAQSNSKLAFGNDFDFYVLSLSWSPSFCLSNKGQSNSDQCKNGANKGFVVHGLWPQYEKGYPKSCSSDKSEPNAGLVSQMLDIMPSPRLVRIEWERHGTCSGLEANEYFKTLRNARQRVNIPNLSFGNNPSVTQVEQAFIKANYGMKSDGIAIISNQNMMSEVRVCLTKNLQFRTCKEVNSRAARDFDKLYIPTPK